MFKHDFKKIANNLLLEPSTEVLEITQNLLSSIDEQLNDLEQLNLDNVKALSHINELKIPFDKLRDDVENNDTKISKQNILENAFDKNEEMVVMKRVVNE